MKNLEDGCPSSAESKPEADVVLDVVLGEHGAEIGHAAEWVVLGQSERRLLAVSDHLNEVRQPAVAHHHSLSVLKVGSKLAVVEDGQRHWQLVPRRIVHRLHATNANQLADLSISHDYFIIYLQK